ncbi:hypothetical protein [Mucilaginibacter jinjuensis]|uniref:Uncharacterized protein n=1 Tax=Mucilaginibacter jinjuensis TaxID=1176721 RepID=A0ABY7TC14_9SPHI|nr:hypothetical protein [Mucilaginibacter jinjuensis]WCT13753.1 hypothetical protein PQO05_07375 [Mucilaginibacter jinjuensis]
MNESFLIPVIYQRKEYEFKARFERWGYTHRIAVLIDEITFTFDPDEEGGYRALVHPKSAISADPPFAALLNAVAEKLAGLSS